MPSKYAALDDVAIHYLHTGQSTLPEVRPPLDRGELLLFVHGAGSNAHTWHRQLDSFACRHSAIAFDFPAHGRSGGTEGLATVAAHVAFLQRFVHQLELRPVVLVGAAMGGAIGLELARESPELLRALVLTGTPVRFDVSPQSLEIWHDVTRGRRTQPFSKHIFSAQTDFAVMREIWTEQVQTDPRVRYTDLLACDGVDFTARLSEVTLPTLVITGRDDNFATPSEAAHLCSLIPRARLAVIDEAGEALVAEQPAAFHAAVEAFLTRLD